MHNSKNHCNAGQSKGNFHHDGRRSSFGEAQFYTDEKDLDSALFYSGSRTVFPDGRNEKWPKHLINPEKSSFFLLRFDEACANVCISA